MLSSHAYTFLYKTYSFINSIKINNNLTLNHETFLISLFKPNIEITRNQNIELYIKYITSTVIINDKSKILFKRYHIGFRHLCLSNY